MDHEIKTAQGLGSLPCAAEIRKKVFMEEQGFKNEFDGIDERAVHAVLFCDGAPAATGRLYSEKGSFHIGRVAVLKEYRGKALGSMIISALEAEAKKMGALQISLSAQTQAQGFYEKLGYVSENDLHMDEFCPHVTMTKVL
ncbi:MAG: GNAT family N-acetyltransferase [Oscillospiraceae bacterium]